MIIGNPLTLGGGTSGTGYATIVVEYPAGSTCTCSDGVTTLTAEDTSGTAVFAIPSNGLWAVTATDGSNTQSRTVTISYKGQGETVYINYGIPTTYKRLEYIGTSGTQRILMTLPSSKNVFGLRYVADVMPMTPSGTGYYANLLSNTSATPYFTLLPSYQNHLYPIMAYNGATTGNYNDSLYGTKFRYEANGTSGTMVVTANGNSWFSGSYSSRSLSQFGLFYENGDTRWQASARLYYFAIYDTDGTTLLRDIYPVMRLEDNVTGLYDTVSGTFFTNNGSGIFTFAEYGSGQ